MPTSIPVTMDMSESLLSGGCCSPEEGGHQAVLLGLSGIAYNIAMYLSILNSNVMAA